MKMVTLQQENKVDELLAVLDEDIEHIKSCLSRLNELRGFIIKRDEASLGKLLRVIQRQSDDYRANEQKRQSIREELAADLGCPVKEMTLTRLETMLSPERKAQVSQVKEQLKSLTEELKKEYLCTVMLLSDCARFNSMRLRTLFDLGKKQMITYGANGSTKRHNETVFVSMEF